MTYNRVIPRDLFNEGNLLKCMGRLWIELDNRRDHKGVLLGCDDDGQPLRDDDYSGQPFEVIQNEATGGISLANLFLYVGGRRAHLERPLNSRAPWPLWLSFPDDDDFDEIEVFTDDGELSPDFLNLIAEG